MKKELGYFGINPFTREKLTLDTLLDIVTFDDKGVYILDDAGTTKRFPLIIINSEGCFQ